MNELTKEQRQQIIDFCNRNEDLPFELIASEFTRQFGLQLTKDDISSLYLHRLIGNPL